MNKPVNKPNNVAILLCLHVDSFLPSSDKLTYRLLTTLDRTGLAKQNSDGIPEIILQTVDFEK